ncbi:5027_t:CDS:2 [Dentiscutata erythropus]|uniref:5027_t:CDS:1 n=1 Tax=Dentiscutata erythropus TaxID=1348616 RepID=A0A9N9NQQ6_9GLOM|nr:5027_t:CDS:2 [Dentiscutata erythropus]
MNSGIGWSELKLNTAIKDYNDKKYKQAFESFYDFVTTPRSESKKPGVAEYLHKYKKYEDAWNIYSELAKADNIKLDALKRMANYYNNGYVKKDERLIFEIALELYTNDSEINSSIFGRREGSASQQRLIISEINCGVWFGNSGLKPLQILISKL